MIKNIMKNIGVKPVEVEEKEEVREDVDSQEETPAKKDEDKTTIEQYIKAKRAIEKFENTFKKQNEDYEARQRMGERASALSPLWGLKPNDYKNDPEYKKAVEVVKTFEA